MPKSSARPASSGRGKENAPTNDRCDDRHERAADAIFFFGKKRLAQLRSWALNTLEKVRGDQTSADLLGRASFKTAELNDSRVTRNGGEMFKTVFSRFNSPYVGYRNGNLRLVQIRFSNDGQALRLRIRERLEQNRVDHAEDGGVRADAERQREHGDKSESGRLKELSDGEAEIGHVAPRISAPLLPLEPA